MKRKTTALPALAVALVLALGATPAWAYFTDTTMANGGLRIGVGPSTDISETYGEGVKHVTITNDEDATAPAFVRARVFSSLPTSVEGTGWVGPDADGWYVYGTSAATPTALAPGEPASVLDVSVTFPKVKSDKEADGAQIGASYNVIVVYESTPAQYDEDGTPAPDWSLVLDRGTEQGGN